MKVRKHEFIESESIIEAYHNRARDELVNRAFKDFGTEQLPFKGSVQIVFSTTLW